MAHPQRRECHNPQKMACHPSYMPQAVQVKLLQGSQKNSRCFFFLTLSPGLLHSSNGPTKFLPRNPVRIAGSDLPFSSSNLYTSLGKLPVGGKKPVCASPYPFWAYALWSSVVIHTGPFRRDPSGPRGRCHIFYCFNRHCHRFCQRIVFDNRCPS